MPHYGYWMGGDGGLWMVFHAAFWLLLVAGLVSVFFIPLRSKGGKRESANALDLLDQRYAKGEIDREEYFQRKNDLIERAQPPAPPED